MKKSTTVSKILAFITSLSLILGLFTHSYLYRPIENAPSEELKKFVEDKVINSDNINWELEDNVHLYITGKNENLKVQVIHWIDEPLTIKIIVRIEGHEKETLRLFDSINKYRKPDIFKYDEHYQTLNIEWKITSAELDSSLIEKIEARRELKYGSTGINRFLDSITPDPLLIPPLFFFIKASLLGFNFLILLFYIYFILALTVSQKYANKHKDKFYSSYLKMYLVFVILYYTAAFALFIFVASNFD